VYGFIHIKSDLLFDLIQHPYFQRLRRIRQLGLTFLVYPGANHTRFQHAIGAMHLMDLALDTIKSKGHEITNEEAEAVQAAILLHDIGHGPFSHALENVLIEKTTHERLSWQYMHVLNEEFNGKLDLAIHIFENKYHKRFLHQLVSSQLDMDRLDYLRRDSFFTGVSEGVIGSDRIIKMLNVVDDKLVIEMKGIYSIEKFLIARRLMYWQVYLHKTVISAEHLVVNLLKKAKEETLAGHYVPSTPALKYFLSHNATEDNQHDNSRLIQFFSLLDDDDIFASAKMWLDHDDKALAMLADNLLHRKLYKIELRKEPFTDKEVAAYKQRLLLKFPALKNNLDYFVFTDSTYSSTYDYRAEKIQILLKNNSLVDVSEASDMLDLQKISKIIKKYFLCYPEICRI
jgi:hypothetical protein